MWKQRFLHQGWTPNFQHPHLGLAFCIQYPSDCPASPGQSRGRAHPTITLSSPLNSRRNPPRTRLCSGSARSLWNCRGSRARGTTPQGHLGFRLNTSQLSPARSPALALHLGGYPPRPLAGVSWVASRFSFSGSQEGCLATRVSLARPAFSDSGPVLILDPQGGCPLEVGLLWTVMMLAG